MRKTLQAAVIYVGFLIIVTFFLLFFNASTPVLKDGDRLPQDVAVREYALQVNEKAGSSVWRFQMEEQVQTDLVLTISDLGSFRLWVNDQPVWESPEEAAYVRSAQAVIPQSALEGAGEMALRIEPTRLFDSAQDVLGKTRVLSAKVLLGGRGVAASHQTMAFALSMGLMGLCLLSFLLCLMLYTGKPTEKYLLAISLVSLICAFTSAFMSSNPLLQVNAKTYATLLPFIAICPVVISPAICFFLCEPVLPAWARRFLSMPVLLALTALLIVLRLSLHYSFYTLARLVMMVPVMLVLARAISSRMWGAWLLAVGYALADGMVMAMYFINILRIHTPCAVLVYLNANYLNYLSIMFTALVVVTHRFSSKFRETETLSANLAEINRTLDARVIKRTAQLQQEQEKRRNMMVNVIHDLRSPLFVLKGYLQQLHIAPEDKPVQEVMEHKLADVERLVEDLFLSAKLEDDACFYTEDHVDLRELVPGLVRDSAPEARRLGVELLEDITPDACPVWADAMRVRQAVQNLVDNAFTYVHAGGSLTVVLCRDGEQATLRVGNTGSFISPEDIPFVFERYYRPGHADNPRSSGLGLSIAREIVKHHRGDISVSSDEAGTVFTVRLPIHPPEDGWEGL